MFESIRAIDHLTSENYRLRALIRKARWLFEQTDVSEHCYLVDEDRNCLYCKFLEETADLAEEES